MSYYFTSESVSEGHPDKVADQISDAILDEYLAQDPNSRVACEVLVTTGQVIIAGEVKSNALVLEELSTELDTPKGNTCLPEILVESSMLFMDSRMILIKVWIEKILNFKEQEIRG